MFLYIIQNTKLSVKFVLQKCRYCKLIFLIHGYRYEESRKFADEITVQRLRKNN